MSVSTSAPLVYAAAPAPALTVAAGRICLAAVLLCLVAGPSLMRVLRLPRRELFLIVIAGVLLGAHFGVWITSLYFTSTAASVALVATQPVFAAIFGHLLLKDRVTRREGFGIAIAAAGCAGLAGGDMSVSTNALIGDGLALLGAATAAGYLVVGRRLRVAIPLTPYLAAVNVVAAISLMIAALIAGVPFLGFETEVYAAIVVCAVLPSIVGHTLLNWSVRRIPAHLVTLAILGEPVGASLLTWIFFAEVPPLHAVGGGVLILLGIAVGFARRSAREPEVVSEARDP